MQDKGAPPPERAHYPVISKHFAPGERLPNLCDYSRTCAEFSWAEARRALDGLPGGHGLNIAHEAVDRHALTAGARTALRWVSRRGERSTLTYRELGEQTNRFANVLARLGVRAGSRIFLLMGRIPTLYIATLGALKQRCVVCPLFSAFGPEPLLTRLSLGEATVLVTTSSLYRRRVAAVRGAVPSLTHVLVIPDDALALPEGTLDLPTLLAAAAPTHAIHPTDPEEPALLHFTSGTTGRPKGVIHVHAAVLMHQMTGTYALDLHPEDIFWCTADPGWVTGMSYGVIAPLTHGVTNVVVEAEFDAETWYRVLAEEQISVWYTAPTAIRLMMKGGVDAARVRPLPHLRFMASVGEPLNPEAVMWGVEAFGKPFHDNWWQTETGGIMVANFAGLPVKPGSMGLPLPGVEASVVQRQENGTLEHLVAPDQQGELALRRGWPSMMRDYLNEHARYLRCFSDDWYLTGDLVTRDADGYLWFVGRADDVIKSSGHLIGPFEVESVLMEHPAVAEAGVIGKPDPVAGEIVKAFVALKTGHEGDEALRRSLLGHARKRLGAAVAPREIAFVAGLPRTRSGKIMRRLLKSRELGLPEGDLSMLEGHEE